MREIKFRAWDTVLEAVIYFTLGDLHNGSTDFEDYTDIEEYTGLKDKNGIEIYEGDIVKTLNGKEMPVVYNSSYALFATGNSNDGWPDVLSGWCSIEVIGNIHENKG